MNKSGLDKQTNMWRAECIGYCRDTSRWFATEDEAWEWLGKLPCRIDESVESCESCQAEWMVFSKEEYKDYKNAITQAVQESRQSLLEEIKKEVEKLEDCEFECAGMIDKFSVLDILNSKGTE